MKKILTLAIFIFSSFFMTRTVFAQEISLSISPPIEHIIAKPGKTITVTLSIVNYGDPTLVALHLYQLKESDSSGNYTLLPYETNEVDKSPIITFTDTVDEPFLLLAQKAYETTASITIPEGTNEQDYYFSIVAQSQDSKGFETGTSIQLDGGVASNLLISVTNTGNTQKDAGISLFSIKPFFSLDAFGKSINFVDSTKSTPVFLTVTNKGSHLIELEGTVELVPKTMWLPHRNYNPEIAPTLLMANGQRIISLPSIPPQYFGSFNLTSVIDVKGGDKIYNSTSFIIFPFILMGWLFLLIGCIGLSLVLRKRYVK